MREEARRFGSRPWEIAALLQRASLLVEQGESSAALETYDRVYNLSRRNGHVEYIPKALLGKGRLAIRQGDKRLGEEHIQKAYELARRNELVAEQGLVLYALAEMYHRDFEFFGLALEYYDRSG